MSGAQPLALDFAGGQELARFAAQRIGIAGCDLLQVAELAVFEQRSALPPLGDPRLHGLAGGEHRALLLHPAEQPLPLAKQRLVRDLDQLLAVARLIDHQQPLIDQPQQHAIKALLLARIARPQRRHRHATAQPLVR